MSIVPRRFTSKQQIDSFASDAQLKGETFKGRERADNGHSTRSSYFSLQRPKPVPDHQEFLLRGGITYEEYGSITPVNRRTSQKESLVCRGHEPEYQLQKGHI